MPRANRHFVSGHVWHITHRCHKKEFLLKFARDRKRWLHWLFEAKKRYGPTILNYIVTSNHKLKGTEHKLSNRGQSTPQGYFIILFNQQYSGRYVSNIPLLRITTLCRRLLKFPPSPFI